MGSGGSGDGGGFMGVSNWNPYAAAGKAATKAVMAGVGAYFDTKTAKATARAQADIMDIQGDLARASAAEQATQLRMQGGLQKLTSQTQAHGTQMQGNILRAQAGIMSANRMVQDIEQRQALAQMGRQMSAATASYRDVQGSNVAQAAAGNVDVSSGSAARVEEGNAQRYANDVAAMRRAYDLQQWNNESQLAMMNVQAGNMRNMARAYDSMARAQNFFGSKMQKAYNIMAAATQNYGASMGDAYGVQAGAYRTVANLQGSAFGNAFTAASLSSLGSFLGGSFDGLFASKQETVTPAKAASPGGPLGYNAVGHQNPSYYESMGITL